MFMRHRSGVNSSAPDTHLVEWIAFRVAAVSGGTPAAVHYFSSVISSLSFPYLVSFIVKFVTGCFACAQCECFNTAVSTSSNRREIHPDSVFGVHPICTGSYVPVKIDVHSTSVLFLLDPFDGARKILHPLHTRMYPFWIQVPSFLEDEEFFAASVEVIFSVKKSLVATGRAELVSVRRDLKPWRRKERGLFSMTLYQKPRLKRRVFLPSWSRGIWSPWKPRWLFSGYAMPITALDSSLKHVLLFRCVGDSFFVLRFWNFKRFVERFYFGQAY